jgi:hypothetical protein
MKYLFFLLLFLSFNSFGSYIKRSDIGSCSYPILVKMKPELDYIKIPQDYNCNYSEIVAETQMKEEVESCLDEADCQSKLELKMCEKGEAIKNLDLMEVYCTWLRPEQVMANQSLKDAYEAEQAQKKAMEDAITQAKKQMACGQEVIALMSVRNVPKSLNQAQMESLVSTYSLAKSLLESGALETAKANIQGQTADGTIVTEDDKAALIAKIDECLGL